MPIKGRQTGTDPGKRICETFPAHLIAQLDEVRAELGEKEGKPLGRRDLMVRCIESALSQRAAFIADAPELPDPLMMISPWKA